MPLTVTGRRRRRPAPRRLPVDVAALAGVVGVVLSGAAGSSAAPLPSPVPLPSPLPRSVATTPVATAMTVASTGNVLTLQDGARVVLENQAPAFVAQLVDQSGAPYLLSPSDLKVALVTFTDLGLSASGPATGTPIVRTAPVSGAGRIIAPTSAATVRTPGHWLKVEFSYRTLRLVVDPVMWSNGATPRQVRLDTPVAGATGLLVADPGGAVNPGQATGAGVAFGDPDGQVTGAAIDSAGLPMPYRRVLLRLSPPGWCWFSVSPDGHGLAAQTDVVTDSGGGFGGRYLICLRSGGGTVVATTVVSGPGPRSTAQLQTVAAAAPSRVVSGSATVRSGARLRSADLGSVTNGAGEPVAGVQVDLSLDDASLGMLGSSTVTTDADGRVLVDFAATRYRAGTAAVTATIAGQTHDLSLGPDWTAGFVGPQAPLPLPGRYRARSAVTVTPVPAVVRLTTRPLGGGRVRLLIAGTPGVRGPLTLYSRIGGSWRAAHRWTSDRDGTASITVRVQPGASRPFRVDFAPSGTLTGTASRWVSVTG